MGINTVQNTSTQEVRLNASSPVLANQLISQTEGGSVFPASTGLSLSNQNVTTAGISAVSAWSLASPTTSGYRTFSEPLNSAQLGNDVIVIAYTGDGSTISTNVNIGYFSEGFGAYQPATIVSTDPSVVSVRVLKINAATFVVGWYIGSTIKFRIYNNDGSAVTAATVVTTSGSGGLISWNFSVNINGDIVFAYRKVTTGDCAFTRYNSSGVIQGAEVVVEAASTPEKIVILSHSNGDFWIYYNRTAGTAANKFARYNSAGVLQATLITVLSGSVSPIQNWGQQIRELGDGSVLMWAMNGSSFPVGYIYDSSGSFVVSNATFQAAAFLINRVPAVFVGVSGFTIGALNSSNTFTIRNCNNSFAFIGPEVRTATTFGSAVGTSGYHTAWLFSDGATGWTIYINGNNGTAASSYIISVNGAGVTLGTMTTVYQAQGGTVMHGGHAFRTNQGLICFVDEYRTSQASAGLYNTQRKTILGVSQESAAINTQFRCATVGTFSISNVPSSPGYFDARTFTPGGCKGTVAGSTAILSGVI